MRSITKITPVPINEDTEKIEMRNALTGKWGVINSEKYELTHIGRKVIITLFKSTTPIDIGMTFPNDVYIYCTTDDNNVISVLLPAGNRVINITTPIVNGMGIA